MEGREIEINLSKVTEAGKQSLPPSPVPPRGVWEVHTMFPAGQPGSQALGSCEFTRREPAPQAGRIQTREGMVALPGQ